MNACCKLELHKAMQNQNDVAITKTMALIFMECLWQSQYKSTENLTCPFCGTNDAHDAKCKFVAAWNCDEMIYLRYSLGIEHQVKVKL